MPRVFINSGTSYTLPADFNPGDNTVECYGSGGSANSSGTNGGGGGAYSKVTNINVGAGATVNIHIGSSGATDTWFNATSVANAVSNGTTISCAAKGGSGATGGAAASGCGTVKFSGGNGGAGGTSDGGGGGGCGGPNGDGKAGGSGGNFSGGGGGGANNGTAGGSDPNNASSGGAGGKNRLGAGGGAAGTSTSNNGGNGSGGGGGGSGFSSGAGGLGSYDDVYSAGSGYGPRGGNGGGSGSGGSGGGTGSSNPGTGLIVITYTSAAPAGAIGSVPPLVRRGAPVLFSALPVGRALTDFTPSQSMGWYRQPADLPPLPPGKIRWNYGGYITNPLPNLTPLYKLPFSQPQQNFLRQPPTLDQRQQFPGRKPFDFGGSLIEDPDTVNASIAINSPINAALLEYDEVVSIVNPTPELGGADDIIRRIKLLLPKGWWNFQAPIRDAIIGGVADGAAWCYSLLAYAKRQTRVAWANDLWLDIIAKDYFGGFIRRRVNEQDSDFRIRIQKELIRERVTRQGMIDTLTDLTGNVPYIFEPWNTGDTGAWNEGHFAWDIGGGWGDTILPAQAFINVIPPGGGIPNAPGWDTAAFGWDVGGMWGDMSLIVGTITNQEIYDTINITRPTGSIAWTQLFPPAGPMPLPIAPGLTPSFAPPLMNQAVVRPAPQRYSIQTMPPGGGPKARVL
jgi:hypothetical protein